MPKVSVIIPTYNAITYLPAALESVVGQTYTDYEVLIIDDGSSDHTVSWASQQVNEQVKLISQKNQGAAGARNRGITHAQGEYIAFLDSDDFWEPTKLEKQVQCLENNPAVGLVNTGVVNTDEQGRPSTRNAWIPNAKGEVWQQIAQENLVFCGSAPMVRRSCFETVGTFDPGLRSAEDWDMWIRIASRYSFAVIKEPLVFYRRHANSKSNYLPRHLQHRLAVIEKTFQSAPPELLYLKNQAYGLAYLSVAWNPLGQKDYKTAIHLRQQALAYYPQLRCSENYIRLGLIIAAKRWLGSRGYSTVHSLVYALRNQRNLLKQWLQTW